MLTNKKPSFLLTPYRAVERGCKESIFLNNSTGDFTDHSGLETNHWIEVVLTPSFKSKTKYLYSDFTKFSPDIFAGDFFSYAIYYLLSLITTVGLFTLLKKKRV